ncbi:hypothetical protein H4582DRAFT_2081386 [Lactarius indigo]|nr:hypothetical protein H4582DRAFT_2081386 [Lactarius indigo]
MEWLDGKRNRRLDHLVFTLVKSADPYYRFRHDRQQAGLDGLNLEVARRKVIEETARTITCDSIEKFDDSQFHVASQTKLGDFYAIKLAPPACNCEDFPCIRFCKHIGAIYFHFPHLRPKDGPAASSTLPQPEQPERTTPGQSTKDTVHLLVQDINRLSHKLIANDTDQSTPSQAIVEAVRSAKVSLSAVITSVTGANSLPHKERIAPNQHSWTETAERMGIKKTVKRRRLPEEVGLTEKTIGAAKGKRRRVTCQGHVTGDLGVAFIQVDGTYNSAHHCRRSSGLADQGTYLLVYGLSQPFLRHLFLLLVIAVYTDPYAGGERPGKLAKPDALSDAANRKAHACALPLASQPAPPLAVPLLSTSQPILGSTFLPLVLPAQTVPNHTFPSAPTFAFAPSHPTFTFSPSQPIPAHVAPPALVPPLLPASQPTLGPASWSLPLAPGPATRTPHNYVFPPTPPSAFPPATVL